MDDLAGHIGRSGEQEEQRLSDLVQPAPALRGKAIQCCAVACFLFRRQDRTQREPIHGYGRGQCHSRRAGHGCQRRFRYRIGKVVVVGSHGAPIKNIDNPPVSTRGHLRGEGVRQDEWGGEIYGELSPPNLQVCLLHRERFEDSGIVHECKDGTPLRGSPYQRCGLAWLFQIRLKDPCASPQVLDLTLNTGGVELGMRVVNDNICASGCTGERQCATNAARCPGNYDELVL